MKVSNSEGVANHIGSESCGGRSNPTDEALTGEPAGWVLSLETGRDNRAPTLLGKGEGHIAQAIARAEGELCGVGDPRHAGKHSERESGEPAAARREAGTPGSIGKSKDTSQ